MGFGPVVAEANEPVFHTRWEARVRALVIAMGRPMGANIDAGRFAREDVSPADYLSKSYYEIWYAGLVRMLLARGLVAQIQAGRFCRRRCRPNHDAAVAEPFTCGAVGHACVGAVFPTTRAAAQTAFSPNGRFASALSSRRRCPHAS